MSACDPMLYHIRAVTGRNVGLWPEAAENDVRSNVGYRRDKRTPCTQNEFCRSWPNSDIAGVTRLSVATW